jgi:tRNA (guanine-N7-)-methyltransferase
VNSLPHGFLPDKNDAVSKKKLVHFKENLTFPHLFQPHFDEFLNGFALQSKWGSGFFMNDHPVVVELGCGKGEYTVGLAQMDPLRNYIGIDVKGARLWRGARIVQDCSLKNAAFIRQRVDFVDKFFGPEEIAEIWITFPDPQRGKERKRLTSPVFLERYKRILVKNGIVNLKTDDLFLFHYTRNVIRKFGYPLLAETEDLYNSSTSDEVKSIQTYYESIWLNQGKKICYLKFILTSP